MAEKNTKDVWIVDTILEKHLVGTVSEKDILKKAQVMEVEPTSLSVEQCMRPIVAKARENISIEECDRILSDKKIDYLAIVDEGGHLCGVYNPAALLPIRQ